MFEISKVDCKHAHLIKFKCMKCILTPQLLLFPFLLDYPSSDKSVSQGTFLSVDQSSGLSQSL